MTNTTLATSAQLADAQAKATAIANSAKVVAPTASFKFLVLLDGTRNIVSDLTVSNDSQPTSVGQLYLTLKAQGDQPNSGYSYKAGVGTPGTQVGSAFNPTQQAEATANSAYKAYADAAFEWRKTNPGGDLTAMMVSFSRGNFTATVFGQKLYTEGLVYTDPDTGAKTTLIRPGEATITANLAISPVNTFAQGAAALTPNVLNTTSVIAGTENRAGFVQADLSSSGATNYVVPAGHGDSANVYLNTIGVVYQPAYQNFLSNAGFPLPLVGPAIVTGPLCINQETASSLGTLQNVGTTTPGKLASAGPAPIVIPIADGGTVTQFENYKGDIYLVKQVGGITTSVTAMQPGGVNPRVTFTNPNPITYTDALGNTTTRNSQGLVLQTGSKQADGSVLQTNFGSNSQVTAINKIYPVAADGSRTQDGYALDGVTLTDKTVLQANGDYTSTRYSNGVPVGVQSKVANPDGSNTISQFGGAGNNLQTSLTTQRDGSYLQNVYDSAQNITSQSGYNVATNQYTNNSYVRGVLQQSVITTLIGNTVTAQLLDGSGNLQSTAATQTFDDGSRLETVTTPDGKVVQNSFDTDNQLTGTITDTPDGLGGTNRAVTAVVNGKEVEILQHASAAALAVDKDNDGNFIDDGDFDTTDINIDDQDALNSDLLEKALDSSYQSAQDILRGIGTGQLAQLIAAGDASDADGMTPVQGYSEAASQETAWYATAEAKGYGDILTNMQSLVAALKSGNPLPIGAAVFNLAANLSESAELGQISSGLNTLNRLTSEYNTDSKYYKKHSCLRLYLFGCRAKTYPKTPQNSDKRAYRKAKKSCAVQKNVSI